MMPVAERQSAMDRIETELKVKPADGLRPIKQVEMRDKWRPLVPREFANDPIYKEPGIEARSKNKKERTAKKKAKTAGTTTTTAKK